MSSSFKTPDVTPADLAQAWKAHAGQPEVQQTHMKVFVAMAETTVFAPGDRAGFMTVAASLAPRSTTARHMAEQAHALLAQTPISLLGATRSPTETLADLLKLIGTEGSHHHAFVARWNALVLGTSYQYQPVQRRPLLRVATLLSANIPTAQPLAQNLYDANEGRISGKVSEHAFDRLAERVYEKMAPSGIFYFRPDHVSWARPPATTARP